FGGPPRKPDSPVTQRDMDLAASIQLVIEEVILKTARHVHAKTGLKNLCLAGGVALNCVANGKLLREGPFEKLWIQPAAGDAGGALGAALYGWYQILGNKRTPQPRDAQHGSYLGPEFDDAQVRAQLEKFGAVYRHCDSEDKLTAAMAEELANGKTVGHFAGRAEFGPRALGHRSILGDPRDPEMQSRMNLAVKFRESFRPFAPSVIEGKQSDYFALEAESPYMLLVANVRESRRRKLTAEQEKLTGIDKLNVPRSELPAVTHVDYSARVQTIAADRSPRFHAILEAFEGRTGCPVLLNTSFNVRGEPMVNTPEDAYRCFMATGIDVLIVGNFLLQKALQPPMEGAAEHRQKFEAD
ncbi:MAG: carbamoyltransferase, partial [Chthoniobacterales bacterium]